MRSAIAAWGWVLLAAGTAAAQQPVARVDYLAGRTVYLRVTQARRWREGDTVSVGRIATADWLGRGRVLGVAESRLSLDWLEATVPLAVGDSVRLELPAGARAPDAVAPDTPAPAPAQPEVPRARAAPQSARRAARVYGRVGLELDALRSTTGTADTERSSTVPTLRLRTTADGLPGDLRLNLNLRAAYRSDTALFDRSTVVNVHEASVERTGRRLQLRLGRFTNLHEPYSGYVDGGMVRVGGTGAGAGVLFGFDPQYGSEGFDADRRKLTVFADVHRAGARVRYDADLSVHRLWGDTATRSAAGLTQFVSLGRLRFHQLLRVDEGRDGWAVSLVQLSAAAPLGAAGRVRVRYSLDDPAAEYGLLPEQSWRWQRAGIGLSWITGGFGIGADAGAAWTAPGDSVVASDEVARTLTGWLDVAQLAAGFGADLNASVWERAEERSVQLAPALSRRIGPARVRAGYRYYRAERVPETFTLQGAEASLFFPLRGADASVRFDHQWGTEYRMTRLLSALWLRL
jgi:hypothetical protein